MFRHHHHRSHRETFGPREFSFHGRGFGRHRSHRAERIFDQGDLRFVILRLVAEQPRHGYEIIKAIEEKVGGAYSPSPGVVYPTLTLLEDLGYITAAQSDGAKKAFTITPEGVTALADNSTSVDSIFQRIAAIAERVGGGPAPQIIRAMENLRMALRLKLERGKLADADVTRITAALDAAVKEIEREEPKAA